MRKSWLVFGLFAVIGIAAMAASTAAAGGNQKPDSVGRVTVEKPTDGLFSAGILCTVDCDGQGGTPDWQGPLENVDQCLGACVVACRVSSCEVQN
jgi:hypothetical protein